MSSDSPSGEDKLIARFFGPIATDPGAPGDFEHFCQTTGHRLVSIETAEDVITIRLEVAALPPDRG